MSAVGSDRGQRTHCASLLLLALPQGAEPPLLELGVAVDEEIVDGLPAVNSMQIESFYQGRAVGRAHRMRVDETGEYDVWARSHFFEPHLVVRDADGAFVTEGFEHGRLAVSLEGGETYTLWVCAVLGWRGPYSVELLPAPERPVGRFELYDMDLARHRDTQDFLRTVGLADSLAYANSLRNMAWTWQSMGNLPEAAEAYRACLDLTRALDPEHWMVPSCLGFLARMARVREDYDLSRRRYSEQLEFAERTGSDDWADSALTGLALVADRLGRREEAIRFSRLAYERSMSSVGPKDASAALGANNLANFLLNHGMYEEARELFAKATAWSDEHRPDHPDTVAMRLNLARCCLEQGLEREAAAHVDAAAARVERLDLWETEDGSTVWAVRADVALQGGRYEEAEEFARRSHETRRAFDGPDAFLTQRALLRVAEALALQGRFDEAFEYLGPLIESEASRRGSALVHDLACLRLAAIELERAQADSAHWMLDQVVGADPSLRQTALGLRARAHLGREEWSKARDTLLESMRLSAEQLERELATMSEGERFRLFALQDDPAGLLEAESRLEESDPIPALSAYLDWKGKLTRLQRYAVALRRGSSDPVTRELLGDVQQLAKQISDRALALGAGASDEQLRALREARIERERELNRRLDAPPGLAAVDAGEVLQAIPATGIVLDFFVGPRTWVWVLGHDRAPRLVDLGESEGLRARQAAFLRRRTEGPTDAARGEGITPGGDAGGAYAEALWGPLRPLVGDVETVFVSPDGFLSELAFGVLPVEGDRYLLERHRFVYLSDTTQLLAADPAADDRAGSVLAVGGVHYSERGEVARAGDTTTDLRARLGETWAPLDGTHEEILALRDLLERVPEWETRLSLLTGSDATEEAVRVALPLHRYLHLATHGYFEPDHLPSILREHRGPVPAFEVAEVTGMLPGLLSGLVFAGVNAPPSPGRDDGYLSAEEVSHLDLSGCDVAVLSACSTALGSRRSGHGLMSLRRAFEVAGAKTVISSLWRVEDRATATLMKQFYENYWLEGLDKGVALHRAKLALLAANRTRFDGDGRPATWGAFVLSGDWK